MPVLSDASSIDWEDPDLVPRPVITLGAVGVNLALADKADARAMSSRKEAGFHDHRKGQFLLWMRGVLTCEVAGGLWLVPPGGAIWVPAGA